MLQVLQGKDFTKINIITLPTLLAIHEGQELKESIFQVHKFETNICCNNSLNKFNNESLPSFLKLKIENENKAISENSEILDYQTPYSMAHSNKDIIKDLVPSMENLV